MSTKVSQTDGAPTEECVMCRHETDANFGQYEPEGFICDDCYW